MNKNSSGKTNNFKIYVIILMEFCSSFKNKSFFKLLSIVIFSPLDQHSKYFSYLLKIKKIQSLQVEKEEMKAL